MRLLVASLFSISCIHGQTTQSFTSPGTTTWTVPAGVTSISIECWGGGGAGGNANTNPTGQQGAAGGGGKGGMYSITNLNVTSNTVLTINVGAGGSNGTAGGTSWVSISGNTPWPNVADGAWSSGGNGASTTTAQGTGATTYTAPSNGSGITYDGGNGAPGRRLASSNQAGGNGGGGGGTQSSGNDGIAAPIAGSGNPTSASTGGTGGLQDGGNGGPGAFGGSGTANGTAGSVRGGGGGGARAKNGGSGSVSASGGAGGRGEIRITYTACPIPSQPVSITGSLAVCDGSTQTYSVSNDPAATSYTWTLPSGWSGTSTTNSIDVSVGATGGTITVVANSSCGNSSPQSINTTVSSQTPTQPVTINGNLTVCANENQTYTIANNPAATSYTWILPSGWSGTSTTNSINASVGTTGGTITVTANNACGNSTPQETNVSVNNIPTQPNAISGDVTLCANENETYSVTNDPNATSYTWTLPSGWPGTSTTNSINATSAATGGTIAVTANNTCGSSTPQTITININNIDNSVSLTGLTLTAAQSGGTYQWLDCDNGNAPISGETNQSFTPSVNGNYAVEITVSGCTETSSCTVVNSVNIGEISTDNLTIFPNPGNGIYTISMADSQDNIHIKMYTTEGKTILQRNNLSGKNITIDISAHPEGVYLLELDNQKSVVYSRIVKQ